MELPRMMMMTLQFSFCCSVQINIEQLSQADKQINTDIDEKYQVEQKKTLGQNRAVTKEDGQYIRLCP